MTVSDTYQLEVKVKQLQDLIHGEKVLSETRRKQGIEMMLEIKQLNADNQSLKYDRIDLINASRKDKLRLQKINEQTTHAGCMGNINCNDCKIQKILKSDEEANNGTTSAGNGGHKENK